MDQRHTLITLAETLAAHQGVTHFAISMRALGKGDFFRNMKEKGYDCRTRTAARLMAWFSDRGALPVFSAFFEPCDDRSAAMSEPTANLADPSARWQHALNLLAEARRAAPIMKHASHSQDRDRATQDYVTAVDALVAELGLMAETGLLEAMTDYLSVVYGRV